MRYSIIFKGLIIFSVALFLSACTTTKKFYPLKTEDVRSYQLKTVQVSLALDEEIDWKQYQQEKENIKAGRPVNYKGPVKYEGLEDDEDDTFVSEKRDVKNPVFLTEEELAQKRIIQPLQTAIHSSFNSFMVGSREVKVNIEVKKIRVARANGINTLIAHYELVDVATDTPIIRKNYHEVSFQAHGSAYNASSSLAGILVSAAVQAAISQATKAQRFKQVSERYANSIKDWMAPKL